MKSLSKILEKWEPVIGLEVHAQLSTDTKMFCGCRNMYGDPPNTHTCPVCLGLPGALPVANEKAIEYTLKLGLALGCKISLKSYFARKNYFYPDLPKGYQISQYNEPLCFGGSVTIRQNGELKEIPLIRIHLEEDAGKSIHSADEKGTKIDFNRCGVPLVEIVSAPEIRSPKEAREYLIRLKQILQYLGICNCHMEQGNLRCDANISLRRKGEKPFGIRTEMKNMNSFRGVERALFFEINRQAGLLESGKEVVQETRLWNESEQKAEVMRGKEDAPDYRYFPEPDLVPMVITEKQLASIRSDLVELPHEKEDRMLSDYGIRLNDAIILASDVHLVDYFEQIVELGVDPQEAVKWMLGVMLRVLKDEIYKIESFPIKPNQLATLLKAVGNGIVNINTAKSVFQKMLTSDKTATQIIKEEGLMQVSDSEKLRTIIEGILLHHPDEVSRYRDGKKGLFGFFMGQIMRKTRGQSTPKIVKEILTEILDGNKT